MPRKFDKQLLRCLSGINRPLTFCTYLIAPPLVPGLEVRGHGLVALPVDADQGERLAAVGKKAPYGRGTRTLVDQTVRRVTMYAPKQLRISNPDWDGWLTGVCEAVRENLGLGNRKVEARLHQLLLYREGDFFLPHQDGEKHDGMVATMAVVLPSHCRGGDLLVRHAGREHRITFDKPGRAFAIQVAAWYADCEHEIEVLAGGSRLVLIYNLVLKGSRQLLGAPDFALEIDALARLLSGWASDEPTQDRPSRLVVPLQHAYSQRGLKLDRLKGNDAAQAQALVAAATAADCRVYLAHLTYRVVGEALSDYDGYYGYEPDDDDVEMGEIIDEELTAEHWIAADGKRAGFGVMAIADDEVAGGVAELKRGVSEQEYEGYTGNAGMELTRWYHRAAVVLWPKAQHAAVLCGGSLTAGIAGLTEAVARLRRRPRDAERRSEARSFAIAVLDAWPDDQRWSFRHANTEPGEVAALLAHISDADLTTRYIAEVLRNDVREDPAAAAVTLAAATGWDTFLEAVDILFAHTQARSLERDARLLATLCRRLPNDQQATGRALAEYITTALLEATPKRDIDFGHREVVDRSSVLRSLVPALHDLDARQLMRRLVAAMNKDLHQFDVAMVQTPTALALCKRRKRLPPWPPFHSWLERCRDALARRVAAPPKAPTDWARAGVSGCDCRECQDLDAFLRDPRREQARFPLRKELRHHLHRVIDAEQLDTTHVTERRGSPYTLVCTKTDGSYRRACEAHHTEGQLHQRIAAVLEG